MRTAGVGSGGRPSGEPAVARARGTLSLSGVPRALRRELALLGAESRSGTGLPAVDIASLEDAGAHAWIAWSDERRQCNLQWIVNHGRFLILPWVRVKGLATKILALIARQLPHDWQARYGHRPVLLETLVDATVDATRFRGTCYRAANWIHIGQTTGRGRMDREHENHGRAIKDIYVYPLVRDARQRLCTDPTR